MANLYNQNPIIITATMGAGWRSLQTNNPGNLPSNAQQVSGSVTRQWGINVTKIIWTAMTAQGHQVLVVDPNNTSVILFQAQAGAELVDQVYDFTGRMGQWRDFQVTTLTSGVLEIHYRS